jgi:purine-cytosine permease-like protein
MQKYSYIKLSLIQVSGYVSLPALMIGFILCQNYGFSTALSSIIIANLLLSLLAIPIANNALLHRQTSAERVEFLFGKNAGKISSLALALALVGWFAINLEAASKTLPNNIYNNLLMGGFITFAVSYGIESLRRIANFIVPIFGCAILASLSFLLKDESISLSLALPSISAVMIAFAAPFTILFDLPTYYRFAKSKFDSIASIVISLFITMSALQFVGCLFCLVANGQGDIVSALVNLESSELSALNIVSIVLGTIIVNNCNLYSASANLSVLLPKLSFKTHVLLLGTIGTTLSYFQLMENLAVTLDAITVLIASITSLLILEALVGAKLKIKNGSFAILFGSFTGIMCVTEIIKVPISAFIVSGFSSLFIATISLLIKGKKYDLQNA